MQLLRFVLSVFVAGTFFCYGNDSEVSNTDLLTNSENTAQNIEINAFKRRPDLSKIRCCGCCCRGPTGPQGPQGPQGPAGEGVSTVFTNYYGNIDGVEINGGGNGPTPSGSLSLVPFNAVALSNPAITAGTIDRPFDKFTINEAGVYEISYGISGRSLIGPQQSTPFELFVNTTAIPSSQLSVYGAFYLIEVEPPLTIFNFFMQSISTQVTLAVGDVVTLRNISPFPNLATFILTTLNPPDSVTTYITFTKIHD